MSFTKIAQGAERTISSLGEWFEHAPPKSPSHWRAGRSAMELARAWIGNGDGAMPAEVAALLGAHPEFGPVKNWHGEPEARLSFDSFPGEPRNSDLLVLAEDSLGQYVLAVEGKADEPYGETVEKALANAVKRRVENPRSNGVARIEQLAAALFPAGTTSEVLNSLRYQLLTACAGAVAEAHRRGLSRAVMLVHEFVTNQTEDRKHESNARDLAAFLTLMNGVDPISPQDGTLYGPFTSRSHEEVRLFVGKVSRSLRSELRS